MIPFIFIFGFVLITVMMTVFVYNKLITLKNRMKEAWSGIDVFLKKRHDLTPNLVAAVKGYATHERATFEEINRYRSIALQAKDRDERITSESGLGNAIGQLMAVAENYPELKANVNFLELQKRLSELEEELSRARRYYNGTVRENNIYVERFPSNIIAGMFNFDKGTFFEITSNEKAVPNVSF